MTVIRKIEAQKVEKSKFPHFFMRNFLSKELICSAWYYFFINIFLLTTTLRQFLTFQMSLDTGMKKVSFGTWSLTFWTRLEHSEPRVKQKLKNLNAPLRGDSTLNTLIQCKTFRATVIICYFISISPKLWKGKWQIAFCKIWGPKINWI